MREHVQNTGINPGLMRAKVKVGGYTTRSDHGNEIREPFDLGYDYCNMEALDGRELQAEKMIVSDVRFRFTFRYRPAFRPNMTIWYGDRIFDVVEIIHDETNRNRTTVTAKEQNPQ